MPPKRGTKLPTLRPAQWVEALRKLGVEPAREKGSHAIYDVPGYRGRQSHGQPYVVDLNWQGIPAQDVRMVLELLGLTEDDLWRVL